MRTYRVTWIIDIEAEDEYDAAEQALEMQRDEDSIATVFEVMSEGEGESVTVDLLRGEMA